MRRTRLGSPFTEILTPEYGCRRAPSAMGKYVFGCPTCQVESHPIGQEAKTCRREILALLSRQKRIKPLLQRMQVEHI